MNNELETLEKLVSFAFVMSENMIGLTKGNYDANQFIKKTYDYLHKYNVDAKSQLELENTLQKAQDLASENNALLEENNELYVELEFIKKQYKELTESAQQQENVLNIIWNKMVDLGRLHYSKTLQDYNTYVIKTGGYPLTQEEFDTLKKDRSE